MRRNLYHGVIKLHFEEGELTTQKLKQVIKNAHSLLGNRINIYIAGNYFKQENSKVDIVAECLEFLISKVKTKFVIARSKQDDQTRKLLLSENVAYTVFIRERPRKLL